MGFVAKPENLVAKMISMVNTLNLAFLKTGEG